MNKLETSLEQNGFRKYASSRPLPPHENASSAWQIRIRSDSGSTLYFINAYFYSRPPHHPAGTQSLLKDAIEFEAHLYPSMNRKHWVSLEFHGCDQESDVHTAMEFFRHAYTSLWCQLDPHNQ